MVRATNLNLHNRSVSKHYVPTNRTTGQTSTKKNDHNHSIATHFSPPRLRETQICRPLDHTRLFDIQGAKEGVTRWWSKSGGVVSSRHPPSLCQQAIPRQRRMDARRILKGHVADEPRILLVIQEERAVGNAADQMAAQVGLEVAQRSHVAYYTIFPISAPPLLLHHWTLCTPYLLLPLTRK